MKKEKLTQNKGKRYNKINLEKLNDAVASNDVIDISNQQHKEASLINIIKRDGRREPFSVRKLQRVVNWATEGKEAFTKELLRDTEIKLHDEIKITDMYRQLIITAVNKISMLYPEWEVISARLQLLSYYKEAWNVSKFGDYPHLQEVLDKGVQHRTYDREVVKLLSTEEIEQLNEAIDPLRDQLFNYKGLVTFYDKYCMNYSKTRKLELPQFSYMRVAIALNIHEKERMKRIIECYDAISQHLYTVATPIIMNALTKGQQLSSCVLNTVADDTHSILDLNKDLGVYSKFKGGTAVDFSAIRAKGAFIEGTQGSSSGPIPFVKIVESTMKAFNQGGKRPGACAIYFPWWHADVIDFLSLKSNGGTDENRARGLKYGIKLNHFMIEAVKKNQDLFLFDPKDVPELHGKFGAEFTASYQDYLDKPSIRRVKINARELWFKIMKERTETGNIYLFHEDNVNDMTLLNRYIGCSNLCAEIVLPSRASTCLSENMFTDEDGEKRIYKKYSAGEIALCNLSSVNLLTWDSLSDEAKNSLVSVLIRSLDNTIDLAHYPVKEGKNSNKMYRYLGIGVLNYANYLAAKEIVIDSPEAVTETDRLFDDLSYRIISASVDLALEKGSFPKFHETEWAQGVLPIHKANKHAAKLGDHEVDWDKWTELAQRVKTYGIRNAQLMAIAPTATSGKSINATESIEPVQDFFYKEEGTITIPTLVPNFHKHHSYYKKSFDCDQMKLVELAAVRQKWLDQSQSVNIYVRHPDSLHELTEIHLYGFHLGMKTFYYLKQQKDQAEEVCESCS